MELTITNVLECKLSKKMRKDLVGLQKKYWMEKIESLFALFQDMEENGYSLEAIRRILTTA